MVFPSSPSWSQYEHQDSAQCWDKQRALCVLWTLLFPTVHLFVGPPWKHASVWVCVFFCCCERTWRTADLITSVVRFLSLTLGATVGFIVERDYGLTMATQRAGGFWSRPHCHTNDSLKLNITHVHSWNTTPRSAGEKAVVCLERIQNM